MREKFAKEGQAGQDFEVHTEVHVLFCRQRGANAHVSTGKRRGLSWTEERRM